MRRLKVHIRPITLRVALTLRVIRWQNLASVVSQVTCIPVLFIRTTSPARPAAQFLLLDIAALVELDPRDTYRTKTTNC
jgi:hypothetical protein